MDEKKKRTQITFDINPDIKQQIKIIAAIRNISVNLLVHRALVKEIENHKKYENKETKNI